MLEARLFTRSWSPKNSRGHREVREVLRTVVWVILECEWSHNSPWTARESRGPLVQPLVAPRVTAAHVHPGCGHPLGALASASRSWPHVFFSRASLLSSSLSLCFVPLVVRRAVVSLGTWWTGPCLRFHVCRSGCVVRLCLIFSFSFLSSVPLSLRFDDKIPCTPA